MSPLMPKNDPRSARLPEGSNDRKELPMARGLVDYFPDALAYVSMISKVGNDKHNPGQDIHWSRGKSTDHADCIARHLVDRGLHDEHGTRHSGYLAWRALALLQEELERDLGLPMPRGARVDEPLSSPIIQSTGTLAGNDTRTYKDQKWDGLTQQWVPK